jgi:hypothetical protein
MAVIERERDMCYSASSERKLLLHKLMCIVLSAVVIALCRAIRVVCLHDVSMIVIDVEGADQGEEEPSHHHVAPGMFLPHKPSQHGLPAGLLQRLCRGLFFSGCTGLFVVVRLVS